VAKNTATDPPATPSANTFSSVFVMCAEPDTDPLAVRVISVAPTVAFALKLPFAPPPPELPFPSSALAFCTVLLSLNVIPPLCGPRWLLWVWASVALALRQSVAPESGWTQAPSCASKLAWLLTLVIVAGAGAGVSRAAATASAAVPMQVLHPTRATLGRAAHTTLTRARPPAPGAEGPWSPPRVRCRGRRPARGDTSCTDGGPPLAGQPGRRRA